MRLVEVGDNVLANAAAKVNVRDKFCAERILRNWSKVICDHLGHCLGKFRRPAQRHRVNWCFKQPPIPIVDQVVRLGMIENKKRELATSPRFDVGFVIGWKEMLGSPLLK